MIEIHDDWHYVTLWYVQGPQADYTVLAFQRAGSASCEVTARFRHLKDEDDRKVGLIDGADGWFPVPTGWSSSAEPAYVNSLMDTVVNNLAVHPEFGAPGTVTVHRHGINGGGAVLRAALAEECAVWCG